MRRSSEPAIASAAMRNIVRLSGLARSVSCSERACKLDTNQTPRAAPSLLRGERARDFRPALARRKRRAAGVSSTHG
jgi:hypothetical protein